MSNRTKKTKKELNKIHNTYDSILLTPWGSLYTSLSIFIPRLKRGTFSFINYMDRLSLPYMDDEHFIEETCKIFGVTKEECKDIPLVCIKSKWNMIFAPYVTTTDKDGKEEITILPINKDGVYPTTFNHRESTEFVDWNALEDF